MKLKKIVSTGLLCICLIPWLAAADTSMYTDADLV